MLIVAVPVPPCTEMCCSPVVPKFQMLSRLSNDRPLPNVMPLLMNSVPVWVRLLPMVTPSSVPLLLVKVAVLVSMPFAMVPLSVVTPVRAVLPPPLLIDPVTLLPPAPLIVTSCALRAAPTLTASADSSDAAVNLEVKFSVVERFNLPAAEEPI